jgi:amino acid adenylation domain-containing protein
MGGEVRARRVEKAPPPQPMQPRNLQAFPCSFAQQRLWFLNRMAPGNPFYNVSIAVPILASIEHRILQRALGALVERHESLRTTFSLIAGEPFQVVGPAFEVEVESVDLRHIPSKELARCTNEFVSREAQRPFDLERGPLIRCVLMKRGALDHVLFLALHHIVCDGWSLGILARELTALYQAFSQGRPNPLPELPIQYVDFAMWQRDRLTGPVLETQLAFWRRKLEGLQVLDLPTDRPRPSILTFSGALHAVQLSPALSTSVRDAARQFGVTPYMLMLAAFAALLHRYSGQTDIVVGAPLAGRSRPEIELLVGFFVNSVVLRIDTAADPSFTELVARVRDAALDAFTHQELPFERLVEEIRPPRDPSRNPIFQVTFQLVNLPGFGKDRDLKAQPLIEIQHRTAIFDLAFTLVDAPPGFSGVIEYSTDLFDPETIAALDRRFQILLEDAIDAPDRTLGRLALVDGRERTAIVAAASGRSLHFPSPSVLDVITRQAEQTPDAVAVEAPEGEKITYRELRTRWRRLARRLAALGVGPETRVAICMNRCTDAVVALIAVLDCGGVYVPLDPGYPRGRLRFMLQDANAAVVLTHAKHAAPGGALEGCAARRLLLDLHDAMPVSSAPAPSIRPIHPDNLAYIIYTSGSTGPPKGVAVSHRALANHMEWMLEAFPLNENDRVLQRTAASFDASVWEFVAPLMAGGRLVLLPPESDRNADAILRTIIRTRISILQVVPALLRLLLDEPEFNACTSLRRIFCGGEALSEDVRVRVQGALAVELVNLYGPTETTIDATAFVCTGRPTPLGVPIGRAIANMRAYVLDQCMQLTACGLEGELFLCGPGLARGYLNQPALTAQHFVPDPFGTVPGGRLYRTGDRVRLLPDGNLIFVGRNDRQIKIRGYRIEPVEIETAIREIEEVKDCAVVTDVTDVSLAAFLVPTHRQAAPDNREGSQSADPFLRDIEQHLASKVRLRLSTRLPEYMIPSRFVVLEALPMSPNGKLDFEALRVHLSQRPDMPGGYMAPRNALEEALTLIWAETLGLNRVGIRDGFFSELGGHSLLAMQVVARIREALRVELPLKQIFMAQTVESCAAELLECARPRRALEETAELYVKVSRMSEEELDLKLAEHSPLEP